MKAAGHKPFEVTEAVREAWYAKVNAIRQARADRAAKAGRPSDHGTQDPMTALLRFGQPLPQQ